jgi:predicted Zn-dependent protease
LAALITYRMRPLLRALFALLISLAVLVRPVAAQSILRDAETEALLNDMSRPLIEAAGLQPNNVQIVMIADNSINAFVAGGQIVYIHSGLITQADSANMVQGVIAHELGHVTGGHVIRLNEGLKVATGVMLSAGQQAALGKFLAFSRVQESSADAAGALYLTKAGISGQGLVAFFKKLQNQEYRYGYNSKDAYDRTHPLSRERVTTLVDALQKAPSWNTKTDPALEARFKRVKAKLQGYVLEPRQVLVQYPETDLTLPARYARAYGWHRAAYPDKAVQEADALLRISPRDPYFLELKGQILLESGKPREALGPLRDAVQLTGYNPLITSMFGHALIATEDSKNFAEAEQVLRSAIAKDNQNPFAWYQLGIVYDRKGDHARAALATAERYNLQGDPMRAFANARVAMAGIPRGSADWVRAQDIFMVSEPELKDFKKKERERREREQQQ